MSKKDVIKDFTSIKGVGEAKAKLLYENGFDSINKLKNAKISDLTKIGGISEKNAKDMINQLKTEKEKSKLKGTEAKTQQKPKTVTKKEEKSKVEEKKTKEEVIIVDEKEEDKVKIKIKPSLTEEIKEKLETRKKIKKRTPEFLREEWFRYKRVPKNWRRPDGITSKMRRNFKYRPSKVRIGFRGPKEVRGLHSSGFEEIMVHNLSDLEKIDPKKQAARIGGTVGTKKRLQIAKKAKELEIRVLNIKV